MDRDTISVEKEWRKIGGGSLRWRGQIIKPNQIFRAVEEDLPKAFRKQIVPVVHEVLTNLSSMKSLKIYYVPNEKTSPRFARAFAKGSGGRLVEGCAYQLGAWAGFGSPVTWSGLRQTQKLGFDWYYGDHGYFNRGRSFRVTRNAYQMAYIQTDGYKETEENQRRLDTCKIVEKPWRKTGRNILVCPPDIGIARLFGFSATTWKKKIIKQVKKYTDRPIVIRERHDKTSLTEALKDTWFLVTTFSNVAVDALIAGIPVHTTDICGAFPLSTPLKDIENPMCPGNRREWLLNLCANQWTLFEIASGMCWDRIGREM